MTQPAKPDLALAWEHYGGHLTERREQQTACIVHEENRPSASVNLDEQVWNCHACGAGGDVYTLIQLKEGLVGDFRAAVTIAEERFGVSGEGLPRAASDRPRRVGLSGKSGPGFRPKYRNTPVRSRPLSSS